MKGTIDFRYDFDNEIVIARPRWHIDTPAEAMRWYQLSSRYFTARFSSPKDLIIVEDAFRVAPEVRPLWLGYRDKALDAFVRLAVYVTSSSQPRLAFVTPVTSGARGSGVGRMETPTVEDAIAAIRRLRQDSESPPSGRALRAVGPASRPPLSVVPSPVAKDPKSTR